jgi:DNA ligase-1
MANREFLMLSQTLKLSETQAYSLGNWYASEKLDGMRAIWLPDTRGFPVGSLPFANLDKSGNPKRAASGLWSRYAKPIWAPDWWTEHLPHDMFLDGELWCGRRQFQQLTSIVKRHDPDDRWINVQFKVFDSPSPDQIYCDGKIHNNTFKKHFRGIWDWCRRSLAYNYETHGRGFERTLTVLKERIVDDPTISVHQQTRLNWNNKAAIDEIKVLLDQVLANDGEGLIVRHPLSVWTPKRMNTILKVKPEMDAEAVITGLTPGEGRLDGMIGALEVEGEITDAATGKSHRVKFKLGSGLDDRERALPSTIFTVGTTITYRYRELTEDGIPREARFLRVRGDI